MATTTGRPREFRRIPAHLLSDEQQAILEVARAGDQNMLIVARAGTGKTTVGVEMAAEWSSQGLSSLVLCFAKRDRVAFESRVPERSRCRVATSNSAGHSILMAKARALKMEAAFDDDRPTKALATIHKTLADQYKANPRKTPAGNALADLRSRGLYPEYDREKDKLFFPTGQPTELDHFLARRFCDEIVWLLRLEKPLPREMANTITTITDHARGILPLRSPQVPTEEQLCVLIDRFDVEVDPCEVGYYCRWAIMLYRELADLKKTLAEGIDYTAQIHLPVYHQLESPHKYDRIFIDEAQDQNANTRDLALLFAHPRTLFTAVGDDCQAIYFFRGADSDSLDQMLQIMKRRRQTAIMPLTLCRRCPQSVITKAQTLVPDIQAIPEAAEGSVDHIDSLAEMIDELHTARHGLVVCRKNAPIVATAWRLLKMGVPVHLTRSDILGTLLRLIDRVSDGSDALPIPEFLINLEAWENSEVAKIKRKKGDDEVAAAVAEERARDKAECLRALAEADRPKIVADMKRWIDRMRPKPGEQPDTERLVVLATVHGAKGGEARTVYIISSDPQPEPLPGSEPQEVKQVPSMFDQVWCTGSDRDNTLYVAVTRAQQRLVIVGSQPNWKRVSRWKPLAQPVPV